MTELQHIERAVEAEIAYRARRHLHVTAGSAEYVHPLVTAEQAQATIPEGAPVRVCSSRACLS